MAEIERYRQHALYVLRSRELREEAGLTWDGDAQRFNTSHVPAGSPTGGQFGTSSGGGSGSTAAKGGSKGKPAAQAPAKNSGHAAAPSATAARKAQLLAQAKADRAQAAVLQKELKAAQAQHPASVHHAAAAHHKAVAASKAPHAAAAHKKASSVTHHHLSAHKAHIAHLEHEIHVLLTEANALDAQAAKL